MTTEPEHLLREPMDLLTRLDASGPIWVESIERPGRINQVWRLRSPKIDAYLNIRRRRPDETADEFTFRFSREVAAIRCLGQLLAPRLLGVFQDLPAILTEAVDGKSWQNLPLRRFVGSCCRSLVTLHHQDPPGPIKAEEPFAESRLLEYLHKHSGSIEPPLVDLDLRGRRCWLHGNPNPGNAIVACLDEAVCWLDWEDTLVGHPAIDFAYLAGHLTVAVGMSADQFLTIATCSDPDLDNRAFRMLHRLVTAYVRTTELHYCRYRDERFWDEHAR